MKKLFALVFVMMFSVSSFANERTPNPKEAREEIRTKVAQLLGKTNFSVDTEVISVVDFLINRRGEIVILDIVSTSPNVYDFIKNKLNYKKLQRNLGNTSKVYRMPIRIRTV